MEMVCTFAGFPAAGGADGRSGQIILGRMGRAGDETRSAAGAQARLQALARCTLGGLEAEVIAAFEPVLLGMLRFEPDERMSAEEVARLLPSVCGIG